MKRAIIFLLVATTTAFGQFVETRGTEFSLAGESCRFAGVNAGYLLKIAADSSRKPLVDTVFARARRIGATVARMWAFHSADEAYPSAIRTAPRVFREAGLRALDYVLWRARENGVKLILCLENYHPHYGGVPLYLKWASERMPERAPFRTNDFYTDDSLRAWYALQARAVLLRRNAYTGVAYRDEPTIFAWELINEASNPYRPSETLLAWYAWAAALVKSLDANHLVTTGEVGYDDAPRRYADVRLAYNGSDWLFNGMKGTSYRKNGAVEGIDFLSFHLYPEAWGLSEAAGATWVEDHLRIADELGKPALLGEFGATTNRAEAFGAWLERVAGRNCRSAAAWQYVPPELTPSDDYAFNETNDPATGAVIAAFAEGLLAPEDAPLADAPILRQNYPNPFNPITTIEYELPNDAHVTLEVFAVTGERVAVLERGPRVKGKHRLVLSADSRDLSSGAYLYRLNADGVLLAKKMVVLK